jgi:hypothetical protein
MAIFDPNPIASRVLRDCLARSARFEAAWKQDYFRAWREAHTADRRRPTPRVKEGPRVQYPKLSPDELAKVGKLDGLI